VEAAAQSFFSTSAARLTLAQAALLAGLIRAPGAYDLFRHPRAALARRAAVLARMERHGHLRRAPAARAAAGLRPGGPAGRVGLQAVRAGRRPGAGILPEAVFEAPHRLVIRRDGRPVWPVANYEGHGFGSATLRSATALSINTVYARLLLRLGGGDARSGRCRARCSAPAT
jgi:membrane peptidoglycan carboxypeptidase